LATVSSSQPTRPSGLAVRTDSLSFRLLASAAIWSIVSLAAAGFILISLYRANVESAFDERLGVYLQTLISALAKQDPQNLIDPGNLGEPRFEQIYSGWYWQVRRQSTGEILLGSKSLFNENIDLTQALSRKSDREIDRSVLIGPEGAELHAVSQTITFDLSAGDGSGSTAKPYEILVAGNADRVRADVASFRNSVILTLAVFAVGLIVAMTIQVRWGLRPLDQVRRDLAALRSGKEHRFEGPFPVEIAPLAGELNALLKSNQDIVERARTQVGNLAHALKTPLSVITNEARAAQGPLADKVAEQAETMRRQINHYLNRARIAARAGLIGAVVPIELPLARLARSMMRIHNDRGVSIGADLPSGAKFAGEQQDLEEIVGNLLDNACKWAKARVELTARYEPPTADAETGRLVIIVDDDGAGLTPEQCVEATRRGQKLDETMPGSGLGLSIVSELVGLYDGDFTLGRAPLGGLRAEVVLPAA
jgi:signal transduction histidine kinase